MVCGSITAVEYAQKFSTSNKGGFTHFVVCIFDRIEALEKYYNDSPQHDALKQMVAKFMDGALEDNVIEMDSWNPSMPSNLGTLIASVSDDPPEHKKESPPEDERKSSPLEEEL